MACLIRVVVMSKRDTSNRLDQPAALYRAPQTAALFLIFLQCNVFEGKIKTV